MEAKLNIFEPKKHSHIHAKKKRNDVEKRYLYLLEKHTHTQLLKRRKIELKKQQTRIANLTKVNVFNREKNTHTLLIYDFENFETFFSFSLKRKKNCSRRTKETAWRNVETMFFISHLKELEQKLLKRRYRLTNAECVKLSFLEISHYFSN